MNRLAMLVLLLLASAVGCISAPSAIRNIEQAEQFAKDRGVELTKLLEETEELMFGERICTYTTTVEGVEVRMLQFKSPAAAESWVEIVNGLPFASETPIGVLRAGCVGIVVEGQGSTEIYKKLL